MDTASVIAKKVEARCKAKLSGTTLLKLLKKSTPQATSLVMNVLCDLGHELGFLVAAKHRKADEGEFLYDTLWWEQRGEFYARQCLVAECEWLNNTPVLKSAGVDNDFLKL